MLTGFQTKQSINLKDNFSAAYIYNQGPQNKQQRLKNLKKVQNPRIQLTYKNSSKLFKGVRSPYLSAKNTNSASLRLKMPFITTDRVQSRAQSPISIGSSISEKN